MIITRSILLLLGIFAAISSIVKLPEDLRPYEITFWGPLNLVADHNRILCFGISLLIILLGLFNNKKLKLSDFKFLILFHIMLFFKNSITISDDALKYLLGFITMLLSANIAAIQPVKNTFILGRWLPLVSAAVLFLGANVLQFIVDPSAVVIFSRRFQGLTNNPQSFAMCTILVIPILLYLIHKSNIFLKIFYSLLFCTHLFFVFISGSRLGLLLTIIAVLMFYRERFYKIINITLPLIIIFIAWYSLGEIVITGSERVFSTEDTRIAVWNAMFDTIVLNPLTGAEIAPGERVGFGENSYLASGVSVGFLGLVATGMFTLVIISKISKAIMCERKFGWNVETSLIISILGGGLIASFFEGALLGVYTYFIIIFIYVASISDSVIKDITLQNKLVSARISNILK